MAIPETHAQRFVDRIEAANLMTVNIDKLIVDAEIVARKDELLVLLEAQVAELEREAADFDAKAADMLRTFAVPANRNSDVEALWSTHQADFVDLMRLHQSRLDKIDVRVAAGARRAPTLSSDRDDSQEPKR